MPHGGQANIAFWKVGWLGWGKRGAGFTFEPALPYNFEQQTMKKLEG